MLGMTGSEEIMANGHSDYDLDIDGVVAELGRLRSSLGSSEEEFGFLANLLQSSQLQSLVQAHSTIMSTMVENQCQPVLSTAEDIAFEVMGEIQLKGLTEPDAVELFRLLQTPHMLNILSAHDMVAQKDYVPLWLTPLPSPPLPENILSAHDMVAQKDYNILSAHDMVAQKDYVPLWLTPPPLPQNILSAHDMVAQKDYVPLELTPLPFPPAEHSNILSAHDMVAQKDYVPLWLTPPPLPQNILSAHDMVAQKDYNILSAHDMVAQKDYVPQWLTPPPLPQNILSAHDMVAQKDYNILSAHDMVAQKDYVPRLPELPADADDDEEETVKIVQLVKSNEPLGFRTSTPLSAPPPAARALSSPPVRLRARLAAPRGPRSLSSPRRRQAARPAVSAPNTPLKSRPLHRLLAAQADEEPAARPDGSKGCEPIVGATIKADEQTGAIVIARVMHGGAADRSGLIHVGDEVLEVNDIDVTDRSPNDVLRILTQAQGTITFKLIPADTRHSARESKVRMRALFDYTSSDDKHIPCREAGLDFSRGDILHIVSQDDIYWWQARREGDFSMRAGLIPSRALQERRILAERTQRADDKGISCVARSPGSRTTKIKKIMYDAAENDDFDREEVATYEEVAKLYPRPGCQRPIVLVGPPGVGRNELKRRLVATNPDKYRSVIPYTSRPQRPGESNGVDYHFVSRADMEDGLARGRFVEFGEYRGNLYGTAQESILSIINAGQVCVLCPHYQAIKMVRTAEMKPYIVYVKPPLYDRLKETRAASYARSTFDQTSTRGFTDDELRDMLHSAARLEFHYGHLFDETIVNDDLSTAVAQLLRTARRVETEPLWVPASWVQ
ncbi:MAGUK p55 subfamily member 7 [Amphibalanus amphitrite]|uniref:MAGUK p55 subfamily member 7 n=1 Tax=Amphibalanus amphitrite TaxID=1232801 RepID=A0A6A4X5M4_AMPAM|nr:MAGUK p55 subfamily member 7 [Amphibalanus amphitrite]